MECPRCRYDNPDSTNYCGKCGMPLSLSGETLAYDQDTLQYLLEGLTRGSVIAERYEVIEKLGSGGMGSVYKVHDRKIDETVALKLIKPEVAFNITTVERFSNEIKLARKITHRNVCRTYDLGEDGKILFITMEYISGQDLKKMIRMTRQLSIGTTVAIARQICEGLGEAHRQGIIHRDLKPQNIMIDSEGEVKIMDFGIARSMHVKGVTATGVQVGTPEYMAPEQAEAKGIDQRTDIYTLGVILYEMATGEVPFTGDTPISIALKHREEIPKDPAEINSQVPESLSHIILKCLQKNKENRYQNTSELLKDLTRLEEGIPTMERVITPKRPKTSTEVTVTLTPTRILVPLVVVLLVVLIAIAGWKKLRSKDEALIVGGAAEKGELKSLTVERKPGNETPEIRSRPQPPATQVKTPLDAQVKVTIPEGIGNLVDFSLESLEKDLSAQEQEQLVLRALRFGGAIFLQNTSPENLGKFLSSLDKIKEAVDKKGEYTQDWKEIEAKLKTSVEQSTAGDKEAAQRSYMDAWSRINRVVYRLKAESQPHTKPPSSRRDRDTDASRTASIEQNPGQYFAARTLGAADKAYAEKDFVKANILYSLARDIYAAGDTIRTSEDFVQVIRGISDGRRQQAQQFKADQYVPDIFAQAQREETLALNHLNNKDFRRASEKFLKAAEIYDQATQAILAKISEKK